MKTTIPTLEKVLRRWMPKENHCDRERLYRLYLQQRLNFNGVNVPVPASEEQVIAVIKKKRHGWFDPGRFEEANADFLRWLSLHKQQLRKERSAKANEARWEKWAKSKENSKKSLEAVPRDQSAEQGHQKRREGEKSRQIPPTRSKKTPTRRKPRPVEPQ